MMMEHKVKLRWDVMGVDDNLGAYGRMHWALKYHIEGVNE
jgi:hypothetical protein